MSNTLTNGHNKCCNHPSGDECLTRDCCLCCSCPYVAFSWCMYVNLKPYTLSIPEEQYTLDSWLKLTDTERQTIITILNVRRVNHGMSALKYSS